MQSFGIAASALIVAAVAALFWTMRRRYRSSIRKLVEAEQALLGGRRILRTLIDNVPDFIYVKDVGMDDFLSKPIDRERLEAVLGQYLQDAVATPQE
ncbi:MAG TPA: hypothetical protein VGN07_16865 [Steroidobacteraceae bacterium]|jgi:CheY-like chemotaxis protein